MKAAEIQRRIEALEASHAVVDDLCEFAIDGKVTKLTREKALQGCSDALYGVPSDQAKIVLAAQYSKGFGLMLGLLKMVLPNVVETIVVANGILGTMYLAGLMVGR